LELNSGTLVNSIGFEWMLFGIAIICFLYAPLLTFLKAPPTKEEKKVSDDDSVPTSNGVENGVDNLGVSISDERIHDVLPRDSTNL
jgi:hypothetical protein